MDSHSSLAFIKLALLFVFMFFVSSGFKRFGIPTIISFLLVGFLAKIFLGEEDVHYIVFFKELGIILLFFFIGLEYTFERLKNMFFIWKPGVVDFALNFIPAFLLGLLFGLNPITSLILASVFYPTSTSITAKLLTDFKRLASPEAELLIGILIFEDLMAIIILSLLVPLKEIGGLQFEMFFTILAKLLIVLAVFYALYRFVLPRINSWL
ncbi:MAG: cation:proton antiporter, partial [candidate division WOR-3 bacterium]